MAGGLQVSVLVMISIVMTPVAGLHGISIAEFKLEQSRAGVRKAMPSYARSPISEPAGAVSRGLLQVRRLQEGAPRESDCGATVQAYISGDKVDKFVIPFSAECILAHLQRVQQKLPLPPSALLFLKGVPITGTTWTEVIVKRLLKGVCDSGIYGKCIQEGCEVEGIMAFGARGRRLHDRTCHVTFGTAQSRIFFVPAGKHSPELGLYANCKSEPDPVKKQCLYLKSSPPRTSLSAIPGKWRHQPSWIQQCLLSDEVTYSTLSGCLPKYLVLPTSDSGISQNVPQEHHVKLLPGEARSLPVRYILTLRDPRDTTISWGMKHGVSFQYNTELQVCKQLSMWTAMFYFWHVEQLCKTEPTLELWYRRMKDDLKQEISKIVEFLGIRIPEDIINKVVAETSFSFMKDEAEREKRASHLTSRSEKMRKGSYGHYQQDMDPGVIKECTAYMKRILPEKHKLAFHIK